jgi:tetratricopeptide (TPR) repeat protein
MADELSAEVFISYKSDDRERVVKICGELKKNDVSVWLDKIGILPGAYYAEKIDAAIGSSKVLLLMCTPRMMEKPDNIVEEVESACQHKIPIIPVRLEDYQAHAKLKLHLRTAQRVDLVDRPVEQWLPELLTSLTELGVHVQPSGAKRIFGSLPYRLVDCFKGRTEELSWLRQKLDEETARLVLISGPQGVGKSALITSLVKTHSGPDAVIYVSMKESPAIDSLAALLSEALPSDASAQWKEKWKDQSPLGDKFEFLFRRLIKDRSWIVLDDLEKVLTSDGAIAPDWMACIERCLANEHRSRIIGVANVDPKFSPEFEADFRMRQIRLPLNKGLDDASGIALLRALEGDEVLGIGDSSDDYLGSLVRRCNGHPGSLKMLIGYLISERGKTLRDFADDDEAFARFINHPVLAVYDNLTAAEREVVRALAVFNAPTSREAIKHILNRSLSAELDILDRRYVVFGRTPSLQLYPQYRRYAYEHIAEQDRRSLHGMAAEWFATQCKRAEEIEALMDVEAYASRCHHLIRAGRAAEADELLYLVEEVMTQRGFAGRVAAIRGLLIELLPEPKLRGRNFRCMGLALSQQGEQQRALDCYRQSLAIGAATGDVEMQSGALISMGWANNELGFYDEAHKQLATAKDTIPDTDRPTRASGALIGNLGDAALNLGRIDEGIELTLQALQLHDGYSAGKVVWLGNLGVAYQYQGKFADAIKCFKEALAIEIQQNFAQRRRIELCRMGRAYLDDNNNIASLRHYEEANKQACDIADKPTQSRALFGLGTVYHARGDVAAARDNYEHALAIAVEKTSHHCRNKLGLLYLQEGQPAEARKQFDCAINACNTLIERGNAFDPLYQMAFAHLGNESDAALTWYRRAVKQCNAKGVISTTLRELSKLQTAADTIGVREAIALLEQES